MKKLLLIFLLISNFSSFTQNYTIGNWYNFKKGAISLTFDDGHPSHYNTAIPEMNTRGLVGTFYVNFLWDKSWAISANNEGHEIANHTKSHNSLSSLTTDKIHEEVTVFNRKLENDLGFPINTFCYPYGKGGESDSAMFYIQDTVAQTHLAARSIEKATNDDHYKYDFALAERDYYQIRTVHMKDSMRSYHSDFRKVISSGGYMTYMFHTIGTPGGWDNMNVDHFTDVLDDLLLIKDTLWIATFRDAICYHKERKTANLTTVHMPFENGNSWVLNLTDSLRNDWFNHPLSIKLEKPTEVVTILSVKQGGEDLEYKIVNDSIVFNAIPDNGHIIFGILNCKTPKVDLSVLDETTICTPDSVRLEVNYDSSYSYSWFKNNIKLEADSNVFFAKDSGNYFSEVKLNGCPINTQSIDISVKGVCGIPNTDFKSDVNTQFKEEVVKFISTSTNLEGTETYYWDFGEGANLEPGYYGAGPVEVFYTTPGEKNVKLTVRGRISYTDTLKSKIVKIANLKACGIYKEDFNGPDFRFWRACNCKWGSNYNIDLLNSALRLNLTDSIFGEWDSFYLLPYRDTLVETLDFSDELYNPILRIRAKASDTCRASFTLLDTNWISTAGFKMNQIGYIDLTTEYQEFELDLNGLFYYEWDNEVVDSTVIWGISITINGGFKNYSFVNKFGQLINTNFVGNVDIDWISIGDKCYPDSLFANISTPSTVCQGKVFNIWNHSNPELLDAEYIWNFGTLDSTGFTSIYDTIVYSETPISKSFESIGRKLIKLDIVKSNGDTISVSENVYVKDCTLSMDKISNTFSLNFNNPFINNIQGQITSNINTESLLILSDLSGKILRKEYIYLSKGENIVSINDLNLSDGIYILTAFDKTSSQNIKIVCKH